MKTNMNAIIIAGQSALHSSTQFGQRPIITGALDTGVKHLGRIAIGDDHHTICTNWLRLPVVVA